MKKMRTTIAGILLAAAAASVALGLSACRGEDDGTTTLTIALWHYTTQDEFKRTLDAYMELNPNVRFDIIDALTSNFAEIITTQLAGGRSIDVLFMVNAPFLAQMAAAGQLVDLTDRVAGMEGASHMSNSLDIVRSVDGRYFSVPWRQDFWPLFYNKDIFEAAGESAPENLTWDDYRDLAIRLSSGSGADRVYGSHLHTWNSIVQSLSAAQLGTNMITDDFSFLRYMYGIRLAMQDADAIMPFGTIMAANVGYRPRFETGRAAMLVMGSWYIGELAERATFNWGIAPVPQMPGSREVRTMGNATSVGIGANSRNVEEAWRFIEFATGEAGALILADMGIPPAFRDDAVMDAFLSLPGMPTDALSRRALSPDAVSAEWPVHPLAGVLDNILNQEHQLIMVGENSIDEGLRRMGERAAAEITRFER